MCEYKHLITAGSAVGSAVGSSDVGNFSGARGLGTACFSRRFNSVPRNFPGSQVATIAARRKP